MSERQARRRRQQARRDVVQQLRRRVGDPPPQLNVHVAARHCWRCRLRYWISGRMLGGIARHNDVAQSYVERVAEYTR